LDLARFRRLNRAFQEPPRHQAPAPASQQQNRVRCPRCVAPPCNPRGPKAVPRLSHSQRSHFDTASCLDNAADDWRKRQWFHPCHICATQVSEELRGKGSCSTQPLICAGGAAHRVREELACHRGAAQRAVAFLTTVPAEPLIGRGILAGD